MKAQTENSVLSSAEPLLNAHDVQRVLKVSRSLVYKWADEGRIPCVRIPSTGGRHKDIVRFQLRDIRAFIDRHYHS